MTTFKKLFTTFFFSVFISSFGYTQTTITIQPGADEGKDARVHSLGTYTSGTTSEFEAMAWTYSGTPGVERSLIDFDFSQIPAGVTITDAKFSLYDCDHPSDHHSTLSGTNASVLQRITSDWGENTVTWENQPSTTEVNQVFLNEITNEHQDYIDIDVTLLVQDIIDNLSSSYGFLFKLQTEEYYRSMVFASSDHTDSLKHPKLVITYTEPSVTCITLQPGAGEGKDARVHSLGTYTSGTTSEFEAMAWTYSGTPGVERSLIDFDFSQIPAGVTITDAKFSLYDCDHPSDHHSTLSGTNASVLQRITSDWGENTVTWENQPSTTEINQVFLNEITNEHQDLIDINVTILVQDIIDNPSTSYGFLFKLQTEEYYRSMVFASSDHTDSLKHPKLRVCYNEPNNITENNYETEVVKLYPNPAREIIIIESVNFNNPNIKIFNIFGQIIFEKTFNKENNQINIQNLSKGTYLVKISSGGKSISKKFIKY